MKFSEKQAVKVFYTIKNFCVFSCNTFVLNTTYSLHKNWQNLTKLATPHIIYYGESQMKYTSYYGESMLCRLFTTRS